MRASVVVSAILLTLLVTSCSSQKLSFRQQPELIPQQFFSGKLCAWGIVYDADGGLLRKFTADINADASTEAFTLEETFLFDDGELQLRTWQFIRNDEQNWYGSAADVVGKAHGLFRGDSLFLNYTLLIAQDKNNAFEVDMRDQLHLINDNVMVGVTQMTWFGFDVGSIHLVIQKQPSNVTNCIEKINPVTP